MKKTLARKKRQTKREALRSEYRFDYTKSKPNRFAAKISEGAVAIVLQRPIQWRCRLRNAEDISTSYHIHVP